MAKTLKEIIDLVDKIDRQTDINMERLKAAYASNDDHTIVTAEVHRSLNVGDCVNVSNGFNCKMIHKDHNLIIYVVTVDQDSFAQRHSHDFPETFDIIKGELQVIIQNKEYILPDSTRITIEPYMIHSVKGIKDTIFICYINY